MHNDDAEQLMKQIEAAKMGEGLETQEEVKPVLLTAVEYLNHLLFSPVPKVAAARTFRSEESSKELLEKADAKRARKNALRLAQLARTSK